MEAERLGATYVTAGHIFTTDCKKGLPPRGLDFLKNVCDAVTIPKTASFLLPSIRQKGPVDLF